MYCTRRWSNRFHVDILHFVAWKDLIKDSKSRKMHDLDCHNLYFFGDRIFKVGLLSRPTNAQHIYIYIYIYINCILYTVSTAACFGTSAPSSDSLILLLC